MSIRITNGALEEAPGGRIVLRGAIDPACLGQFRDPVYQREIAPQSTIDRLSAGLKEERAPDVELAQRTGSYDSVNGEAGVFALPGPVYIIDGLQRITAAAKVLADGGTPLIGALVHFNTTEGWERKRFHILNQERTRVSPNIVLRNATKDHPMLRMLEELTHDHSFALADRISWSQRMQRSTLITALVYCQVVSRLHLHRGGIKANGVRNTMAGIETLGSKLLRQVIRDNVKTFFGIIDACWGVAQVVYHERATYLKGTFLLTLADVFADHENFWEDAKLSVSKIWQHKLATFPVNDPHVVAWVASGSRSSRLLLYPAIVNHLNSGKRNHKLAKREQLRRA